jgi:hypothetical protein
VGAATAAGPKAVGGGCAPPRASGAYTGSTLAALRAHTDLWGNRLLAAPGGPTYAGARRYLRPLLYARGAGGRPLTASGVYYLPFAQPDGARGAGSVALHVADGSQILAQRVGGRSLAVSVGTPGAERFGSCLARLGTPALAGGYLPILETRYRDARGRRYRQESFSFGRPLVSYVRVDVPAGGAVRLAAGRSRVSSTRTVYAAWSGGAVRRVDAADYDAARGQTVAYWQGRLDEGTTISVPEARVANAERALLIQDLALTWRYSIGNPYEEFSFPEGVDVAQVLAEHGFQPVARSILATSLTRKPTPYPNWKKGERLLAVAEYARLSDDRAYLAHVTPVLRGYVAALGRQIAHGGLLGRERYSSDIPNGVYGLHSQAVVWAGLRAIADAWGTGADAARARSLAAKLERALRRAVRASERRLPDGSLFIPVQLLDRERPYASLTQERLGSYWNLVMPYALASGLFPPGSREAKGALRYMLLHGSRLLGLVRAGGYALYGRDVRPPVSGTDQVYGNNVARFLADNDQADQLVLSLYGMLAASMTPQTFVSGEAASVAPLDGAAYRAMYLPPNGASNAAFLETLRLMLVHETPAGLQLAYATPRAWLGAGKRIAVASAPTSFGPLSYSLAATAGAVSAAVDVPERTPPRALSLRLRLPRGGRIAAVTVGGRAWSRFDRATGTIDLSGLTGHLDVVARLSQARATN